ncbi:MAG TPA: N-acyl homoserine lactonase family protein [Candidatus Nanoarchaeia archaeon]|nr:N-acyl homoserine lactonase family protein [Candidatus Nanoarchaeia archaeon]
MNLQIIKNGYLECDKGMVTLGRDMGKKIKIPVYCYLLKHKKGNVLIDTGFSKDFKNTWGKRLNFYSPILETDIPNELKTTKIDFIINTHLHIDHCENNSKFKDATIITQKKEFESAKNPPVYQKLAYPDKIDENLNYKIIDGKFDIFDDKKILIIPTEGHTSGHQSVLLDTDEGNVFIAGDACYTQENLKYNCLPGILWSPDKIVENYEMIRNLKDTKIIFGHEEIN